jgi:methylthioribose-1-phosphate isomerase
MSYRRTIWLHPSDSHCVQIIDQRYLPHRSVVADLRSSEEAARAIAEMWVRGAPLIGATAAWGVYLATLEASGPDVPADHVSRQIERLGQTRPTAVNLHWALARMQQALAQLEDSTERSARAREEAQAITDEDVAISRAIGEQGLTLIKEIAQKKPDEPVQIMTHCNAGRLATIEYGTATAPIYLAHEAGIPVHVWVSETRPRNQGAFITAWELAEAGIPHTVIVDNAAGHLMQHGQVDLCFVGTDRTTRTGDVANKIGTYLKSLAAHDNGVPFYVCLPSTTIDWRLTDGVAEIPIETRSPEEVTRLVGWNEQRAALERIRLTPPDSPALNYGFDVTPARYVTGLITERGICEASEAGLQKLFPQEAAART